MKVIPENIQYRILSKTCRSITSTEDEIAKLFYICAYATLLGRISESNIINLCSFAKIDITSGLAFDILRFYLKSGFIEFIDEGMGLVTSMKEIAESFILDPSEADIMRLAKDKIDSIRRDMLNG